MNCIFGYIDLVLIEYTCLSGRAILNVVKVANGATEHVRENFVALRGDAHLWRRKQIQQALALIEQAKGGFEVALAQEQEDFEKYARGPPKRRKWAKRGGCD
jgi:hypothetical protein